MYEHDTPYHRLRVTDNDGVRLLKFERNQQSSMHLDDPFETDIEYVGYLHLTLAVKPDACRALVIGLGGGSVVKRMWRDYLPMSLDVVEIDPDVIDVARSLFAVPDDPRIRIFAEDGRGFVRLAPDLYDIVIVDAFDDDRVPRQLTCEEFMRDVRDCMTEGGVIAYNYIGSIYGPHSKPFRSLYRTLANTWARIWVFPLELSQDARDTSRNVVVLASDAELTDDELLERISTRVGGIVTVPRFERFGEDLYRGTIRSGDVPLLVEAPSGRQRRGKR